MLVVRDIPPSDIPCGVARVYPRQQGNLNYQHPELTLGSICIQRLPAHHPRTVRRISTYIYEGRQPARGNAGQTALYGDMPYEMSLASGPVGTPAIYDPEQDLRSPYPLHIEGSSNCQWFDNPYINRDTPKRTRLRGWFE
ncbi:hypothetical protein L218DRAFT_31501 [Marasmius fiardii PR-910]|nr:hypothetical protein L218DRAFT_31501 [Marasmius fiardii PR-910]